MSEPRPLAGIRGITFDFGNTLVTVDRATLRRVVERAAERVVPELGAGTRESFLEAWAEERDRQFREEVPRGREVDLSERVVRVVARLRGMPAPGPGERWDQDAAGRRSSAAEVERVVAAYSGAFVETVPAPPESRRVLARLAGRGFAVAILSNWPLAATIDRFAEVAGWRPLLAGIFVSQRIGVIKPNPQIYRQAADALGIAPGRLLHVGDDWAADVVGAIGAGWHAAYLRHRQGDTPLPTSSRTDGPVPDFELDALDELDTRLEDPAP
jgi:HAD superfamily hydrolase (TIGR01509 family)